MRMTHVSLFLTHEPTVIYLKSAILDVLVAVYLQKKKNYRKECQYYNNNNTRNKKVT